MREAKMILGQDRVYSMDCHRTQLNNNVLVVGASGAGKTRSIVIPNILMAEGSYVISDPKGNLYSMLGGYLKRQGYEVKKLDFTDMSHSIHYNFFHYIHSNQDIVKLAHMLAGSDSGQSHLDKFWHESSQLLMQAGIAYLCETAGEKARNLNNLQCLMREAQVPGNMEISASQLDMRMDELGKKNPHSYAYTTYQQFRVASNRTLRSILITVNAKLAAMNTPETAELTSYDDVDIPGIGQKKTALFVVVSDTDRSMDQLVNIFFSQMMNELCLYADKQCSHQCLPVPVRFILDDFATNCKIDEFPRMISSIRSRGISTMIMVQAESQLEEGYGQDGRTIIANCDTYVYLGGNDLETAKSIAARCDIPVKRILNMPVGTNWIFRRGQEPVCGKNFDLRVLREENLEI